MKNSWFFISNSSLLNRNQLDKSNRRKRRDDDVLTSELELELERIKFLIFIIYKLNIILIVKL